MTTLAPTSLLTSELSQSPQSCEPACRMSDLCPPCESSEPAVADACIAALGEVGDKCQPTPPTSDELLQCHNRLADVNKFTINPNEPVRGMQELVQELMAELGGGKKDLNRLYNIMMSYDASGNEWKRFEYWDAEKRYTRNLIVSIPGAFTLMLLCWNAAKGSPIHNHAGSECFMRILSGRTVETQYVVRGGEGDVAAECNWNKIVCSNIPPSDLIQSHQRTFSNGECTFINDSLGVHKVDNPFEEGAVTLHCYIPGYDTCKSWSEDANPSDPSKCIRIQEAHISFDTEQGEKPHA